MKKNVIIFSLNTRLLSVIKYRLSFFYCNLFIYSDLNQFYSRFYQNEFDFIIIDDSISKVVNLFGFCKKLKICSNIPIFLIANKDYLLESTFFEVDEVLVAPFSLKYFDLKVLSLFKISKTFRKNFTLYSVPLIVFSNFDNKIFVNSVDIYVTKTEFKILSLLLSQKNFLCHKSIILSDIWGYSDPWSLKSNIVEMHISKLKKKLIEFFVSDYFLRKKDDFFLFSFYNLY